MRHGPNKLSKMARSTEQSRHQRRSVTEQRSTPPYSMSSHAKGISYIVKSEAEETRMMIESSKKG